MRSVTFEPVWWRISVSKRWEWDSRQWEMRMTETALLLLCKEGTPLDRPVWNTFDAHFGGGEIRRHINDLTHTHTQYTVHTLHHSCNFLKVFQFWGKMKNGKKLRRFLVSTVLHLRDLILSLGRSLLQSTLPIFVQVQCIRVAPCAANASNSMDFRKKGKKAFGALCESARARAHVSYIFNCILCAVSQPVSQSVHFMRVFVGGKSQAGSIWHQKHKNFIYFLSVFPHAIFHAADGVYSAHIAFRMSMPQSNVQSSEFDYSVCKLALLQSYINVRAEKNKATEQFIRWIKVTWRFAVRNFIVNFGWPNKTERHSSQFKTEKRNKIVQPERRKLSQQMGTQAEIRAKKTKKEKKKKRKRKIIRFDLAHGVSPNEIVATIAVLCISLHRRNSSTRRC